MGFCFCCLNSLHDRTQTGQYDWLEYRVLSLKSNFEVQILRFAALYACPQAPTLPPRTKGRWRR